MNTIDFSPLYRHSVGFDRLESLFDNAFSSRTSGGSYPPYNIEVVDKDAYVVSIAVAGFAENELDIQVDSGVLKITGKKSESNSAKQYLHQGIGTRAFERKFNLADYVEVKNASLENGLLSISLKREVPEAMKPRSIDIRTTAKRTLVEDSPQEDAA